MNLNNRQNSRVNYNENEHQCVDLDTDNDDYKLKISTSFRNKRFVSSWKQETTETNWYVLFVVKGVKLQKIKGELVEWLE
jgi:hypothetical protein